MPARKKPAEPKLIRVRITLAAEGAKVFTSKGPVVSGSILDLPEAEAVELCERDAATAVLADQEVAIVEPFCDVEQAANNPNAPGTFRARHSRQLVSTDNAVSRTG